MKIAYKRPENIRMNILSAAFYICEMKIYGSYYVPESVEDIEEDINHFKFLRKYNLITI